MSIIKEKILTSSNDSFIKINLGGNKNVVGVQQEINYVNDNVKEDLTNSIIDSEIVKFNYDGVSRDLTFIYNYYSESVDDYYDMFIESDIKTKSNYINNSFYILDIYDKYDDFTQTKILTNYSTKLFGDDYDSIKHHFSNNGSSQLNVMYVPETFIGDCSGVTVNVYGKFSFYNAETGNLAIFKNEFQGNTIGIEKTFYEIKLNLSNYTWDFNFPNEIYTCRVQSNNSYAKKQNNSITDFNNQQQNYPSGDAFDGTTGKYD